MKQLSIVLAVFNEERYLRACLDAVADIADEIIIVDGGSTDSTLEIAKSFHAHIIRTDNPSIFHINKQKALDAASAQWILQLDADEIVTEDLKQEILTIIHANASLSGYYIPRRNIFWGHAMKKTGVYPDYVIRLLQRGKGMFPCKSVHEQIEIDGAIGYLTHPLIHYSYETMSDYWRKAKAYTDLTAKTYKEQHIDTGIGGWLYYFIFLPMKTFFLLFFRNQGFADGIYGLFFSIFSALHHPIAYWKYIRRKV